MSTLPQPRGPVSEALFAGLRKPPHRLSTPSGEIDPEDLQLALYCCYELHYRGFEGVDDRWEWEPFGKARADTGTTATAFGYGGEQKDDETGLVNLRARYYDPAIGRFCQPDAVVPDFANPQALIE